MKFFLSEVTLISIFPPCLLLFFSHIFFIFHKAFYIPVNYREWGTELVGRNRDKLILCLINLFFFCYIAKYLYCSNNFIFKKDRCYSEFDREFSFVFSNIIMIRRSYDFFTQRKHF